jgi:hypothetical protein
MARIIRLIPGEWESMYPGILANRDNFDEQMYNIVFNGNTTQSSLTKVYFPEVLTTADRYRIHTFSQSEMISSKSDGEGINRYIICNLTNKYLKFIYDKYYVEPEPVIEDPLTICRKTLFTSLLNMVKEQFGDLFEDYLKSI